MSISTIDALVLVLGVIALVVAWGLGVFRARSILGADRVDRRDARALAGITFMALVAWQFLPVIFVVNPDSSAATQPTSVPSDMALTPRQLVGLSLLGSFLGLMVMLVGNLLLRPGGLSRLGLSLRGIPQGVAAGVLATLIVVPITFVAIVATDWLWRRLGIEHPEAHKLLLILGGTEERTLRIMAISSATLAAPIFEEIFFRGHVQTLLVVAFERLFRPPDISSAPFVSIRFAAAARWMAIVATSLLFACAHEPWMIPPLVVLSLGLGYAYERSGNLWAPIVMHGLFNILNVSVFVYLARH